MEPKSGKRVNKMKTVAFVPVKLNNERLPGKNTKPFHNGDPLICYILRTLLKTKGLDEIYVYCSDPAIQEYLPKGVKWLRRDPRLDSSSTLILEVLQAFARDVDADTYVLAHATAPFISRVSVESGILAVNSGEYDSAMTVKKLREFLWINGVPQYDTSRIPRTQDLGDLYAETTGLYIYKKELLMEQNRRTGDKPFLIPVSDIEACDINEPFDFEVADMVFNRFISKGEHA